MEVPLHDAPSQMVTFQVDLLAGGRVRIAYGEAPVDVQAVVGIATGHGLEKVLVVDLSAGATC